MFGNTDKYSVVRTSGTTTFSVKIENVDYSNTEELLRELRNIMMNDSNNLIVDLTGVKYIDNFGMNFVTNAERLQIPKRSRVRLLRCYNPCIRNEEIATAFIKAYNT